LDGAVSALAIDSMGNTYVTGLAHGTDIPTTPGAFQRTFAGGGYTVLGE
jgi:hypothetical protein